MESDNPDIQWALELLRPDPSMQQNAFSKYYHQIGSCILAPPAVAYVNRVRRLPILSRPHYYALTLGGFLYFSRFADKYYENKDARTDAIMRDYIIRHPEDFPPPERKKYGELFTEWVPIR